MVRLKSYVQMNSAGEHKFSENEISDHSVRTQDANIEHLRFAKLVQICTYFNVKKQLGW